MIPCERWGKCASERSCKLPKPGSYEVAELRFEHKRLRQVDSDGRIPGALRSLDQL